MAGSSRFFSDAEIRNVESCFILVVTAWPHGAGDNQN